MRLVKHGSLLSAQVLKPFGGGVNSPPRNALALQFSIESVAQHGIVYGGENRRGNEGRLGVRRSRWGESDGILLFRAHTYISSNFSALMSVCFWRFGCVLLLGLMSGPWVQVLL
jgi:hypothetical protein